MATQAAATYTNAPATVALDRVRFELGDTDCDNAFLSDAEIRFALGEFNDDELLAAAESARRIVAVVARKVNFSHGPVRKDMGMLTEHFRELARDLDRRAAMEGARPEFLAETETQKDTATEDTGLVQPYFKVGDMDNPRTGSTSDPQGER